MSVGGRGAGAKGEGLAEKGAIVPEVSENSTGSRTGGRGGGGAIRYYLSEIERGSDGDRD